MAALPSMGALYISSPEQVSRSSASSDSAQADHQLVAGMGALQNPDNGGHRAYIPSLWNGCLGSQTSSDDLDNYALHGSPALSSLPQTASSNQSSPRSWDSPEQLGPTPWEAATEQLHSRYPGLDSQLPGYLSSNDIPTSFSSDGMPLVAPQSFDGADNDYQRARSQTEPYPAGYHTSPRDGYPSTPESGNPLSPCSTTLSMPMDDITICLDDDVDSQAPTLVNIGPETRPRNKRSSAPQVQPGGGKPEEPPYAQLIYRAFLSTPRQAMTLQEIYQWFRENTDRGKSANKGWQNSIRHNLSMNHAFTKRDRRNSTTTADTKNGSANPTTHAETKKSTEWFLEPWAVAGVQSTTRYRKDNQSRRSATSHAGLSSRVYRSYPAHHHHSFGRKGGRIPRGSRQSLRSNSSAASTQPQLQHYHFPPSPHQQSATRGPFLHLINDPSLSPSPYGGPTSFFHHSPTVQAPSMDRASSGTELNYNYPDPQLFPSHTSPALTTTTMARASSDPGTALNEPVTPEPLPLLHHHHSPYGQLLPDLRGSAGGVVSPPPGNYHHHHHHHSHSASHGAETHGLPFVTPNGYPLTMPEVYADAMDTDGGAYHHQQQQQLHHHHLQQQQQQQVQGWVATASGVAGLEGMGQCGEDGVTVPAAGYTLGQGF
ncbi:hypothetical protein CHGG_02048 [Chaetomium globosum CBS 148.51]|uniref:Fork-head domain-containing protein n=1 Tax=Chaetomium globosum (strain ATCC 6205 / CBS 148.51 / DSM 1962 / NBRC 6347 / NRRL 1970) TaxID=306901 RepID=Q2HCK6_CHAGB|nr:uncharacterized protein CHGG_02048 [Chaetomium globosum CBS 148.51]EAQ93813.1 hypothetical protein CHGG_02048 [Chaetomium globosum CBS 148.51]